MPQILESKREDFYQQKVADVYEYYERELRKNNALDFDDLLLVAVKLLQSNEAVLDKYSKRFSLCYDRRISRYEPCSIFIG